MKTKPKPGHFRQFSNPGVVPNSDPCQIITPLVLVGLGLGVGEGLGLGVGLGLGNQIVISRRGVIIWQGVENGPVNTSQGSALRTSLTQLAGFDC